MSVRWVSGGEWYSFPLSSIRKTNETILAPTKALFSPLRDITIGITGSKQLCHCRREKPFPVGDFEKFNESKRR